MSGASKQYLSVRSQQTGEAGNLSNLTWFANFCSFIHQRFDFFELIKKIKINGERKARKPTEGIAFIFFTVIWGAYGCIKAGTHAIKTLMNIVKTEFFEIYSDSLPICKVCYETLRTYLGKFRLSTLRKIHFEVIKKLEAYKAFVSARFKDLRIAAIDGTHVLNGMYICVLALLGKKSFYYDFATYTKGMEIPAAKRLLRDIIKHKIFAYIDVLLMDALYFINDIIKFFHSQGKKFVIRVKKRIKEAKYFSSRVFRKIIQQAWEDVQRFIQKRKLKYSKSIHVENVHDKIRNRRYEVYIIRGLFFAGVKVTIYFVRPLFNFIDEYKKIRAEEFFIVANINSAEKAVLLATERFQIEELYDVTKNDFNIKYDFVYNNNFTSFRRLFTMIMTAANIMLWYVWCASKRNKQKINFREAIRSLRDGFHEFSLCLEYFLKPGRLRDDWQLVLKILHLMSECKDIIRALKSAIFSQKIFST